jgi:hypothetical protein
MGRPARPGVGIRARLAIPMPLVAALILAACAAPPAPGPTATSHAAHDPRAERVMAELSAGMGMSFGSAGPHHQLGRGPGGVELDLVGVPVEQVILSVPADDPEAGLPYLPHLRDLLHGPDRVYDWVAAMLTCRTVPDRACEERLEQGNVEARFTDGGPDYVVVTLTRGPD